MASLGLIAIIGTGHQLVLSKRVEIFSILTSIFSEVSNIDKLRYEEVSDFPLILLALYDLHMKTRIVLITRGENRSFK